MMVSAVDESKVNKELDKFVVKQIPGQSLVEVVTL